MKRLIPAAVAFSIMALGATSNASAQFTQFANIKMLGTGGTTAAKGTSYVSLDTYQGTRDSASTHGPMKKTNPVGTVNMAFPVGSTVNKAAVGAGNVCNQSEYASPALLATACPNAVVGTGWALLNTGSQFPSAQDQPDGAPAPCLFGDTDQYSRDYRVNPGAGPSCVPLGELYVKIIAYQGAVLKSQYWCYGMDIVNNVANTKNANGTPKDCYFKAADKTYFNFSGGYCKTATSKGVSYSLDVVGKPAPAYGCKSKSDIHWFRPGGYNAANNACNLTLANINAAAPLAFGGSVNGCKNTLQVVIPAMNGAGSGLGEITGGFVLADFYLKIADSKSFLKAPACPASKKFTVNTAFTYSKFLGESALPASTPAGLTVPFDSPCIK